MASHTKPYPLYQVRRIESIRDLLQQSISLYGPKAAFLVKHGKNTPYTGISFTQLGADVTALGTAFLQRDFEKIAVIGENRYEWAISYLAAVTGKATVIPLDKELPAEDIANLLGVAQASCIIYSKKLRPAVQSILPSLSPQPVLVCMDDVDTLDGELTLSMLLEQGRTAVKNGDTCYQQVQINPERAQILLFTSGTTAFPKAVMLSHKNIVTDLMAMCQMIYIDDKDIFLSVLPLHHTYECTCGFLCPIYRGCTIAYGEGLKSILQNLKEARCTMMLGVPALFETMYKRLWSTAKKNGLDKKLRTGLQLSRALQKLHIDVRKILFKPVLDNLGGNLRLFISGAAAIDPKVSAGFRDFGIAFLQGYGITECSPIVAVNRDNCFKDDAAGLFMPCMDVKLADVSDDGTGEIICRGDNVMLGYYQNDEATQQAFLDGWFRTGDLGSIDAQGFVHITGRKKNVIVTKNGKNIFPEELETLLNRDPNVLESLVYGVYEPSDGETYPCAQLILNMEHICGEHGGTPSAETLQQIAEQAVKTVNDRNPLYKYIRRVTVRETAFEKTTTQKIKRYKELEQNQQPRPV